LEWNGHSLVGKTFDEVHDVITDSRHDPQVELRVARSLSGGHAHATPSSYAIDALGRSIMPDPSRQYHQFSSNATGARPYPGVAGVGVVPTSRGRGPSVTLSDPLGGTTHMLAPPSHHHSNHHPGSTRIQVGQ
jgi:hypothetical protein